MQAPENPTPEQPHETRTWGPLMLDSIGDLIQESNNAFLPSAAHPNQTTADLITELRASPFFQLFGYSVDGKPVSYIVAFSHADSSTLLIGPMYVSKEHQGQGWGKRQVEDLIEFARSAQYKDVYTKTWSKNTGARTIFESLGFAHVKTKNADRSDGDSTVGYALSL